MGKPIRTLNRSIQGPGLGRNLSQRGSKLSTTYGKANPKPTHRKTSTIDAGVVCGANANPTALARNGALHGVERIVARTPLKKAPLIPSLEASDDAAPMVLLPSVTSKIPNRFKATSVTRVVSTTSSRASPNCIPQLTCLPTLFNPTTNPASTKNETN